MLLVSRDWIPSHLPTFEFASSLRLSTNLSDGEREINLNRVLECNKHPVSRLQGSETYFTSYAVRLIEALNHKVTIPASEKDHKHKKSHRLPIYNFKLEPNDPSVPMTLLSLFVLSADGKAHDVRLGPSFKSAFKKPAQEYNLEVTREHELPDAKDAKKMHKIWFRFEQTRNKHVKDGDKTKKVPVEIGRSIMDSDTSSSSD